jgi:hypothetical protein
LTDKPISHCVRCHQEYVIDTCQSLVASIGLQCRNKKVAVLVNFNAASIVLRSRILSIRITSGTLRKLARNALV